MGSKVKKVKRERAAPSGGVPGEPEWHRLHYIVIRSGNGEKQRLRPAPGNGCNEDGSKIHYRAIALLISLLKNRRAHAGLLSAHAIYLTIVRYERP